MKGSDYHQAKEQNAFRRFHALSGQMRMFHSQFLQNQPEEESWIILYRTTQLGHLKKKKKSPHPVPLALFTPTHFFFFYLCFYLFFHTNPLLSHLLRLTSLLSAPFPLCLTVSSSRISKMSPRHPNTSLFGPQQSPTQPSHFHIKWILLSMQLFPKVHFCRDYPHPAHPL